MRRGLPAATRAAGGFVLCAEGARVCVPSIPLCAAPLIVASMTILLPITAVYPSYPLTRMVIPGDETCNEWAVATGGRGGGVRETVVGARVAGGLLL